MSFDEEVGRIRGEVVQRITTGIGLVAQGLDGLSSVLHRTAQALEQISEMLVSQAVDEEFAEDLAEREEEEDAKDVEDDGVMDDLDTPPPPPAEPYGQTYESPIIETHDNPFGTR